MGIYVSSSGPTNSMRGAAFLASLEAGNKPGVKGEAALVVDIGGTTVSSSLFILLSWCGGSSPRCVRSCGAYFQTEVGMLLYVPFRPSSHCAIRSKII